MLPSPDILNDFPQGKFVLSNLAAKRAKQLREGATPLVQVDSIHPLTIALAEIAAGKIKPIVPTVTESLEIEHTALLVGESVPAELGMLLPAIDDAEVALISTIALEEDADAELDGEDAISLSDLVGDEEEEAVVAPGDEDTLSLSDLADAENAEEDGGLSDE